ncbi:LiaI-LiaF-like domain-containing protein [Mucilaginibacter panaciglaebae]|uniref:LiaI-LiaF-like transmembrane region domain-containing protein n=1 Tax=Mucilaginibacter panaciglaebae TaxID=502331 RepID=A0ABP7WS38_9SPHI
MRNDKIIPGVVLILIGTAFLLHNYGVIHFHWGNFFHLWPIFIVIGGINLIFANNRSAWATTLKLAVIIVGFGLIVFGNFGRYNSPFPAFSYYDDDDYDDSGKTGVTKVEGNSEFNAPFAADARVATLNISGGGTVYRLSDTTSQLFSASTKEFKGRYVFTHSNQDSVYTLNFNMRGHHDLDFNFDDDNDKGKDTSRTNSATFRLNPNPEWNINVKTGATSLDFDLSKFKIRSVKLAGGAAAFDVKLGQPLAITNVDVATGMSDVTIRVPATAACHIKSSTGLSSTTFDGFAKMADNTYETPGFSAAKNKMFIKISGGMADIKVKRY